MCGYFAISITLQVTLNHKSLFPLQAMSGRQSVLLCAVAVLYTMLYTIATAWTMFVALVLPLRGSDAMFSVTTAA